VSAKIQPGGLPKLDQNVQPPKQSSCGRSWYVTCRYSNYSYKPGYNAII